MSVRCVVPGMSEPDAMFGTPEGAIRRVRTVSHLLDEAVRVPGTDYRVGLDAVVSLVPISGDVFGGLLSLYVVLEAINLRAPPLLLVRMCLNVAVDVLGGAIPIIGIPIDAAWKANVRNVRHIERHVGVEVTA